MSSRPAVTELLLPRVARGETDAVEACLERYAPLVWTLARRLLHDASALEDVVQEVFVDIWKSAERYDPEKASEATFIATITRRRIIDRQRRSSRAPEFAELDEDRVAGAPDAGLERVDARDEVQRATRALALLRPEQRQVILMSIVEGLTHQAIATATGMPLGTLKSHIRRGLDQAAQILRSPQAREES